MFSVSDGRTLHAGKIVNELYECIEVIAQMLDTFVCRVEYAMLCF